MKVEGRKLTPEACPFEFGAFEGFTRLSVQSTMLSMGNNLPVPKNGLEEFCRRNRIRKLAFFGSVLRPDFGPESDVDVLVEFELTAQVGFFELYDLEQELSRILGGRKVDLRTPEDLSRYFRDEVVAHAQVQYAHE